MIIIGDGSGELTGIDIHIHFNIGELKPVNIAVLLVNMNLVDQMIRIDPQMNLLETLFIFALNRSEDEVMIAVFVGD